MSMDNRDIDNRANDIKQKIALLSRHGQLFFNAIILEINKIYIQCQTRKLKSFLILLNVWYVLHYLLYFLV